MSQPDATENTPADLARAESLGRIAAKNGQPVTQCPFEANGSPEQRELAIRYVRAYYRAEPTRTEKDGTGWWDRYR